MLSNLGQGYRECRRVGGTHTRDKGGKDRKIFRSKTAASSSPVFALSVAANLYASDWIWMGPINGLCWIAVWFLCCTRNHSCSRPQTHTKYAAQYAWVLGTDRSWIGTQVVKRESIFQMSFFASKYLPSLCTSPKPSSICWKHKQLAIQCMSQVTEWWSGCRDMLAQS